MAFVYLGLGIAIAGGILTFFSGIMDLYSSQRNHAISTSICFVIVGLSIALFSWMSTWDTTDTQQASDCNAEGKIWYNKENDERWVRQCLTQEQVDVLEKK